MSAVEETQYRDVRLVKKELKHAIVKLTAAEVQCPDVKKEDTTIYSTDNELQYDKQSTILIMSLMSSMRLWYTVVQKGYVVPTVSYIFTYRG